MEWNGMERNRYRELIQVQWNDQSPDGLVSTKKSRKVNEREERLGVMERDEQGKDGVKDETVQLQFINFFFKYKTDKLMAYTMTS